MAEVDRSPLETGSVVGTDIKENIAAGYQRLGNVVQEPVPPGVTGEMVLKAGEARAKAITALASGIGEGFSPLIDNMIKGSKEQQAGADYAAGAQAGGGLNVGGAAPSGSTPAATPELTPASTPGGPPGTAPSSQVARGSDGIASVIPSLSSLVGGGQTYSKTFGQGLIASSNTADQQYATQLHTQYPGDPEGFKGAWNAYVGGRNYGQYGPQIGTQASLQAAQIGGGHYNTLVTQKASQDLIASGKAIETQIQGVSNDMSALARGGQMSSPEFDQKQAQLQDLYGQLGENPAIDKSQFNVADKLNEKLNQFQFDNVISKVDSAYVNGGASAAMKSVGDAVDKIPGLSDTERAQFLQQGEARVRYNQGINKDQVDINDARFKNLEGKIKAGDRSPEAYSALDGVIASSKVTGDHVTQVNATDLRTSMKAMPAGLSPSEVRGAAPGGSIGTPQSGASVSSPANLPQSFYDRVHAIENPNNVRGANSAGATGKYQFIPSTWAQYGGGGDIHSDAAQEGAMRRLTADNFQSIQSRIGRDPTQAELYLAHQQGAAGAVKLIENPGTRAGDLVGNAAIRQNGGNPNASASAFVSHWAQKFDGTTPQSGGGGTSSAPPTSTGTGTPFSADQIKANPGLYTSYTDLTAGDTTVRTKAAADLGKTIEVATSNHELPPPETTARYFQMAQDIPDEQERLARVTGAVQTLAGSQGGGGSVGGGLGPGSVPGGGSYQQQVAALVAGKDDLFKMGVRAAADKSLDAEAAFAKSHPIEYSARKGWSQMPPPIDFSNPQSVAQGFQANAQITAGAARREPGVSLSAVPESIKPQVAAALVSADPQQAVNVLNGIAALPKDARDATIKDMSKEIVGATKSGDPVRMGAAYSLMDQEYRENPMTIDDKFGPGALSELRKWQEIGQFQTTAKIAQDAMKADDPGTIKARDALKEYANDKILNTVTGNQVADKLAGPIQSWNPFGSVYTPISDAPGQVLGALKYDYDQNYKEQYGKTANTDAADKYALERVALKWGQSAANGGRFMAYPPERSPALPVINGDKSWIGQQLGADVAAIHPDGKEAFLVPDQQSQAEMTSGRVPSYQVVTRGTDGSLYAMPKRWAPDPARAQAEANASFGATNATVQPQGGLPGVAGGMMVAH